MPSIKNSSGFTLVELMVAMLIMMVGMFGLLETLNVSIQHNVKNDLRSQAIRLGEKHMSDLRLMPFDSIIPTFAVISASSKIRGTAKNFVIERTSQVLAEDTAVPPQSTSKQLTVVVKWAFRNMTSQNKVISVVARP